MGEFLKRGAKWTEVSGEDEWGWKVVGGGRGPEQTFLLHPPIPCAGGQLQPARDDDYNLTV